MAIPRSVATLAFALIMGVATTTHAQPDDKGAATELFNVGRDLMKGGDYAAACPKLAESARLDAKVGTLARLAECEEKLGHLVSARAHWQQAVNVATAQRDDRLAHVQGEFARIDRVVPKLVFAIDAQPPPDLTIKVDDLQVGLGSVGVPLPVGAGQHVLQATASGRKPWSVTLETRADGAVTTVHIPALEGAPLLGPPPAAVPIAPPEPAPPGQPGSSPLRALGVVTLGAGIVGLGVGAAFGFVAKQKVDDSKTQGCDANSDCPPTAFATRNDARSDGNLSTVFFVAGGALTAAGLTLWLLAPKSGASASTASLRVAPSLAPGSAGWMIGGSF